jgi:hypothetical protein
MLFYRGELTMRFAMLVAAFGAACMTVPAQATIFVVSIQGTVTGTKETFNCTGPQTPSCYTPYTSGISISLGPVDLIEGANYFSRGGYYSSGETDFTIIRNGNYLTGVDLSYGYKSCSGIPPVGCYAIYSGAPTFAVTGGVPEPTTWAMVIGGFAMLGAAMRRRQVPVRFA